MSIFGRLYLRFSNKAKSDFLARLRVDLNRQAESIEAYGTLLKEKLARLRLIQMKGYGREALEWLHFGLIDINKKQNDSLSTLETTIVDERLIKETLPKIVQQEINNLGFPELTISDVEKKMPGGFSRANSQISLMIETISNTIGIMKREVENQKSDVFNSISSGNDYKSLIATLRFSTEREFTMYKKLKQDYATFSPVDLIRQLLNDMATYEASAIERELARIRTELGSQKRDMRYYQIEIVKKNIKMTLVHYTLYYLGRIGNDLGIINKAMTECTAVLRKPFNEVKEIRKRIDALSFITKEQHDAIDIEVGNVEQEINSVLQAIVSEGFRKEIEAFYVGTCLGFLRACEANDQAQVYAHGYELAKIVQTGYGMIIGKFDYSDVVNNIQFRSDGRSVIHGVYPSQLNAQGSWLGIHDTRVNATEYIARIVAILQKGLRSSARDQFFSTQNHRAIFFFDTKEVKNSDYGPIDVIFSTNGKYALLESPVASGSDNRGKEYAIFIPEGQALKENFDLLIDTHQLANEIADVGRKGTQWFIEQLKSELKERGIATKIYVNSLDSKPQVVG